MLSDAKTMPHDNTTSEPMAGSDLYCLTCGYNQRGILADRCPECGQLYAAMPPSPVRIPWAHRRHLGWLVAYWRTVWMVLFHGKQLGAEMQHPASYRDARQFWLFHTAWVYFPLLADTVADYLLTEPQRLDETILFTRLYAPIWPAAAINLGAMLFIAAATGLPSYFCHPRRLPVEQQNRAVALSYYAAAPLVATPLVVLLLILAGCAGKWMPAIAIYPAIAGLLLGLLMLATWCAKTASIVATLAGRDRWRLIILLVILWPLLAVWLVLLTPLLLHYSTLLVWTMVRG
ncbi:MAG TPA: hypothetical protein VHP11_02305 [Tepidisphaeraceae bacterium]|nr:hypothetical protein [Tepidisphaeraceae bacterium]